MLDSKPQTNSVSGPLRITTARYGPAMAPSEPWDDDDVDPSLR